ncbi:MAG: DUF1934 family protein [Traorella sp.]
MKKRILIKQKDLKENQEQILCDQICQLEKNHDTYQFSYHEKKPYNGIVTIQGNNHEINIHRLAENKSSLHLISSQYTKGKVESIYGSFEIDLYTHHYFHKEELIAVEYDILNGKEILESYRLMIRILD